MAFRKHLLVVGSQTIDSPELVAWIKREADRQPVHATLLAPATPAMRDEVQARLAAAAERLGAAGIETEQLVGDGDPVVAVQEAWNPARYDGVVVSTFAAPVSKWMQIDVPHRIQKLTDCEVHHVACAMPRPPLPAKPVEREQDPLLVRLASLLRTGHADSGRSPGR
jgi:hypothetical protein